MSILRKIKIINLIKKQLFYLRHLLSRKIRFFRRYKWVESNPRKDDKVPYPLAYKLSLTSKCNLQCKQCMVWGDRGWSRKNPEKENANELEWNVAENIFRQIGHLRPHFILSGGEPLMYSHFRKLAEQLRQNRCFATICTNGFFLDEFVETISINPYLNFLISLDGPEKENDILRGDGVYRKVIDNIKIIKSLKTSPYAGVQFTIRPENVHTMHSFCGDMVDLGVDWILLNPYWFVTGKQAKEYENSMLTNFGISPKAHHAYLYPYNLDAEQFHREYLKIKNEKWPIQISCYFDNPEKDIYSYINSDQYFSGNTLCYKQWLRMDITPDAKVTACAQFPDLILGDLKKESITKIWNSPDYAKLRNILRKNPLPICNKCNNIYLYDAKRKYL